MEPRFYGFWEGLFSIGLNWIFVALVCRQLFCVALSLASPCIGLPPTYPCIDLSPEIVYIGLSLGLLKGFGTAETF